MQPFSLHVASPDTLGPLTIALPRLGSVENKINSFETVFKTRLPAITTYLPSGLTLPLIMSLIIDCIRPPQPSTPSLPQLQVDFKDALYTPTLTRIITLSANIMEATEAVKMNKDSCLRLARLIVDCVLRVRTILHDRWDPPPYGIKAPLDQLESLLLTISDWIHSLSQTRFLTQILKQIQVRHKIEELKSSLIDRISDLQDAIFEEVRRTLRLKGNSQVVLPPRTNLVLTLRLLPRPEITYPQPGPHIHSRDSDGYPIIHRSDIVLHEDQRPTRYGGWWENTSPASIDGRSILVKSYDGTRAEKNWSEDIAFLKSVWDAHLPQLFGMSHNSTPLFIILHDTGRTDLKSFVTPYIRSGQLLHVAAVASRVAEHLRVCGSFASCPRPSAY